MTMTSRNSRTIAWIAATWLSLLASGNIIAADESSPSTTKCGIYLAQSTIPGSGLGMFAGDHYFKKGDTVTEGDTVIPIVELKWNNLPLQSHDYKFLWNEYTWNGIVFGE